MANLTITAYYTRKLIKYGGLLLAVVLLLQWSIAAALSAYKKAHPPEEIPTVRFKKLAPIIFPQKEFDKKQFTFELPGDELPKAPKLLPVFVVYRSVKTLLALDEDTKTARAFGFIGDPVEISNGIYRFRNDTLNQTLTMNVLDGSFNLQYPYSSDQLLANPESMPTKEQAVGYASSFLTGGGRLYDDLRDGVKETSYFKMSFDKLEPMLAANGSNIMRVDFFRKPITFLKNDYKIMSSDYKKASVSILVTGSGVDGKRIVDVNYKYANIDRESFSTYPIKTPAQAQADLVAGNYWPARNNITKSIAINNIYLAYFEPSTLTNYMQPVYVFEDDKASFVAYVSAVADNWISQ